MSLPLTRMMCVNVWLHVRTCSAYDVGRCFWQQYAHRSDIWIRKYTPKCGMSGNPVRSWNLGFRRNLDFSGKVGISAKTWIFRIFQDFRISALWQPDPTFGGQTRFLAPKVGSDRRPDFRTFGQIGKSWADLRICPKVRKSGPKVRNIGFPVYL